MQGTLQNVASAMAKTTAELSPQQQYAEFASDKLRYNESLLLEGDSSVGELFEDLHNL